MRLVAGMSAVLAVAGIVAAAPANATDEEFTAWMHAHGYSDRTGDSAMVKKGYEICYNRSKGWTREQVEQQFMNDNSRIDATQAHEIVDAAYDYLCDNEKMPDSPAHPPKYTTGPTPGRTT